MEKGLSQDNLEKGIEFLVDQCDETDSLTYKISQEEFNRILTTGLKAALPKAINQEYFFQKGDRRFHIIYGISHPHIAEVNKDITLFGFKADKNPDKRKSIRVPELDSYRPYPDVDSYKIPFSDEPILRQFFQDSSFRCINFRFEISLVDEVSLIGDPSSLVYPGVDLIRSGNEFFAVITKYKESQKYLINVNGDVSEKFMGPYRTRSRQIDFEKPLFIHNESPLDAFMQK